ncbi:hypothetical protein WA158_006210 [Blastocystis sp. Blastoise]
MRCYHPSSPFRSYLNLSVKNARYSTQVDFTKYLDDTNIPSDTCLSDSWLNHCVNAWTQGKMFEDVRIRRNGKWVALLDNKPSKEFETCIQAAKYRDGYIYKKTKESSILNFPEYVHLVHPMKLSHPFWINPKHSKYDDEHESSVPIKPFTPLSIEEIQTLLHEEDAQNIRILDLQGRSLLAHYMVFVTGINVQHMRTIGDTIVNQMKPRRLKNVSTSVEGREGCDWMVVDCGSIILQIFNPLSRIQYNLEDHWECMIPGQDRYGYTIPEESLDPFYCHSPREDLEKEAIDIQNISSYEKNDTEIQTEEEKYI